MTTELVKPIRLTRSGHFPADSGEFTVLGFTTTGLPGRIVEFAAVRVLADGTVLDELNTLVGAAPAPSLTEVAGHFVELCRGSVLVTHDLSHETRLLAAELSKAGVPMPMLPGVCTADAARSVLRLPNYRLTTVAHALGISTDGPQTALGNARLCGRILTSLLGKHRLALGEQPRFRRLPIIPLGRLVPPAHTAHVVQGWFGDLVERLPSPTGGELERSYAGLLADAFADRHISAEEATALADQASAAGLTGAELARIHLGFVESMVALAKADGVVTAAEQRDLRQLATVLGVPEVVRDLRPTGQARRVLVLGSAPEADALRAAVLDAGIQLAKKLTASVTHLIHDDGVSPTEPRLLRARELGAAVLPIAEAGVLLGAPAVPSPRPEPTRMAVPAPRSRLLPAAQPPPRRVGHSTSRPATSTTPPTASTANATPPAARSDSSTHPRTRATSSAPPAASAAPSAGSATHRAARATPPAPNAAPPTAHPGLAAQSATGATPRAANTTPGTSASPRNSHPEAGVAATLPQRVVGAQAAHGWAGTATMAAGMGLMGVTLVALFAGAPAALGLLFGAVGVGALLFGWRVHEVRSTVD